MVCWDEREESQICKISVVLFPVIFILSYSLKSYIPDSVTKPKSNGHFFASFAFCLPKLLPRLYDSYKHSLSLQISVVVSTSISSLVTMDLSLDLSFDDSETLLVIAVQSFVKSNASPASIEALVKHKTTATWSLSIIQRFTTFLRNNLEELRNSDDILNLLNQLLDYWPDTAIYTTLVYEESEEGFSILTILTDWMLRNNDAAILVVSKVWQALERLQFAASWQQHPLDAWWVDSAEWMFFAQTAISSVCQEQEENQEVYCANVALLASMLQFNVCDWITPLPMDDIKRLVDTLLGDAHVWEQGDDSTRRQRQGLLSMRLLSLMQMHAPDDITRDFDNMANSTSLVENVLHVAFPIDDANIPLWACNVSPTLRPLARGVVHSWNQGQGEAWACVLAYERHWGSFLSQAWNHLMQDVGMEEHVLQGMLLLHKLCPLQAKSAINPQGALFADRLLSLCHEGNAQTATCAAALFRLLLGDRRDVLGSDEVSRSAWTSLESHKDLMALVVQLLYSRTKATTHSLLVAVLDILDLAICHCSTIGASIDTKEVEMLIDLMHVKEPGEMVIDEDTPQANNLSRIIDESHLDLGAPCEKEQVLRGMDGVIAVAAGTAVARYGSQTKTTTVLKSRIQRVVHDYVDGFQERNKNLSFDLHRRFFRLQIFCASKSDDDEEMIATTQWKRFECHRLEVKSKGEEIIQYRKQIGCHSEKIQALTAEKRQVQLSVKSQAVSFQRHLNRSRKGDRMEASRLVEQHVGERSKAESRVADAIRRVEIAESRQTEAQRLVEESKASQNKAKEALQMERSKVEEAERILREQRISHQKNESEVVRLRLSLKHAQDQVTEKATHLTTTLRQLDMKETQLNGSSEAFEQLQCELESAYEKLVSIAQIYEIKEEETDDTTRKIERDARNARRKLEHEIHRNDDLEEESSKLQRDNERLLKKLERAKEQVEQERREREEDKARRKRTGPVSYINQLHSESQNRSMASNPNKSMSSNRSMSSNPNKSVSSNDRRKFTGKENRIRSSTTSTSHSKSRGRYDDDLRDD